MRGWFAVLAGCAVLSELAEAMAPEGWKTQIRRIAALAVMLVLIAPFGRIWTERERILGSAEELFSDPEDGTEGRETWIGTAEFLFSYAEEKGVNTSDMTAAFSEENGELAGIRLEVRGCPYALRAGMEEELTEAFGVPVTVENRERSGG